MFSSPSNTRTQKSSAFTPAEAQYLKGYNFEYGFGTAVNYQQAAYWYGQAADQGYAHAQYTLGRLYEGGVGVIREYGQAKAWYQKAADQGYEPAKDALKRLLATDTPTASTTETTPTAPEDQYKVGDHYYYGVGVLSRTISKQYLGIERPPIRATRPRNSSWARSMSTAGAWTRTMTKRDRGIKKPPIRETETPKPR